METERVNAQAGALVDAPGLYQKSQAVPQQTNELGKDAFLKLLVAQLRYQDPLDPSSSEEFISTTAQFTVVEKLDELTKQGENTALVNALTTASSLVGREITAQRDGVPVTTVVEQSRIVSGAVQLETAAGSISLDQIVSVGAVPAPAPVAAPTSAPTSTANSGSTDAVTSADETTESSVADAETDTAEVPDGETAEVEDTETETADANVDGGDPVDVEGADPVETTDPVADLRSDLGGSGSEPAEDGTETATVIEPLIDSATETVAVTVEEAPESNPVIVADEQTETSNPQDADADTVEIIDPIEAVQPIEAPPVPEVAEPAIQAPVVRVDPPIDTDALVEPTDPVEAEPVVVAEPIETEPVIGEAEVAAEPVAGFDPVPAAEPVVVPEAAIPATGVPETGVPETVVADAAVGENAPVAEPVEAELDSNLELGVDPEPVATIADEAAEAVPTPNLGEPDPVETDIVDLTAPVIDPEITSAPVTAAETTEASEATDPAVVAEPVARPVPEVTDPFDPFEQIV